MPAATKTERLAARVSPDLKAMIQRAADLRGRSLTDFVVDSARAAAEETLRAQQIVLSATESAAFVEALLTPTAPNERLRAAVKDYRAFVDR